MAVPRRIKIVAGVAGAWLAAALLAAGPFRSEEAFGVVIFLVVVGPALGIALGVLLVGGVVKWTRSVLGRGAPEGDDDW